MATKYPPFVLHQQQQQQTWLLRYQKPVYIARETSHMWQRTYPSIAIRPLNQAIVLKVQHVLYTNPHLVPREVLEAMICLDGVETPVEVLVGDAWTHRKASVTNQHRLWSTCTVNRRKKKIYIYMYTSHQIDKTRDKNVPFLGFLYPNPLRNFASFRISFVAVSDTQEITASTNSPNDQSVQETHYINRRK